MFVAARKVSRLRAPVRPLRRRETKSARGALLSVKGVAVTNLLVLPATVASDTDPATVYNQLDRGSDRGSGYWQTNTILRSNDKVFITWQSYDPNTAKYAVWVGTFQYGTNTWLSR